jgi:hypothetical protein
VAKIPPPLVGPLNTCGIFVTRGKTRTLPPPPPRVWSAHPWTLYRRGQKCFSAHQSISILFLSMKETCNRNRSIYQWSLSTWKRVILGQSVYSYLDGGGGALTIVRTWDLSPCAVRKLSMIRTRHLRLSVGSVHWRVSSLCLSASDFHVLQIKSTQHVL